MRQMLTFIGLSALAFACAAQQPIDTSAAAQPDAHSHRHDGGAPQARDCAARDSECRLARMQEQMDAMSERLEKMQAMMKRMMGERSGHMMRGKPADGGHDHAQPEGSALGGGKE